MTYLFTSESVSSGHPDKLCDQISDAILDAYLEQDPHSRVAVETFVKTGFIIVGGEVTSTATIDIQSIVRGVVRDVGYNHSDLGFDADSCGVLVSLSKQSPDIAQGVDVNGAGDQGLMFGYACNETPECMPLPIALAHRIINKLEVVRKDGSLNYLRPDAKTQVTVEYNEDNPVRVHTIVLSTQHSPTVEQDTIKQDMLTHVIKPVCGDFIDDATIYHVNPTGKFVIGGPVADAGLTGRKIIVDTYGGTGRHGGGAFSGKDPTKVDRSAAYMARYIAKQFVKQGKCGRCEVQLAYAIGVSQPVSIHVNTFGTGNDRELEELIRENYDCSPKGIIEHLDLRKPQYRATAVGGHFGREQFAWERN
jgi:S-adenosylmethionine synthetase